MGKGQAIYGRLHRRTVYGCCADILLVEGRGFNSLQMRAFDMKIKKIKKIKKNLKKVLAKAFYMLYNAIVVEEQWAVAKGQGTGL